MFEFEPRRLSPGTTPGAGGSIMEEGVGREVCGGTPTHGFPFGAEGEQRVMKMIEVGCSPVGWWCSPLLL